MRDSQLYLIKIQEAGLKVTKHWNKGQYIIDNEVTGERNTIRFHKGRYDKETWVNVLRYYENEKHWSSYTIDSFIESMIK